MMKIKPIKSELKLNEREIKLPESDVADLRTMDSDIVIKKLEESIKLREMPIEKRILKK